MPGRFRNPNEDYLGKAHSTCVRDGCGTLLNGWNPGPYCHTCLPKALAETEAHLHRQRVLELAARGKRKVVPIGHTINLRGQAMLTDAPTMEQVRRAHAQFPSSYAMGATA
jgi:hypothetical protein